MAEALERDLKCTAVVMGAKSFEIQSVPDELIEAQSPENAARLRAMKELRRLWNRRDKAEERAEDAEE